MGIGVWDGKGTRRDTGFSLKRVVLSLWMFPDPFSLFSQDPERLCFLSMTLRPYQALLEGLGNQGGFASSERMQLWAMRLDLRDLQRHLRFQVEWPPAVLDPQRPKLKLIGSHFKTMPLPTGWVSLASSGCVRVWRLWRVWCRARKGMIQDWPRWLGFPEKRDKKTHYVPDRACFL